MRPKSLWKRPVLKQIKVNVDGSFHLDEYTGSVSAVLWDTLGNFVRALTIYIPNIAYMSMPEAVALRKGLALANSIGYNNVLTEPFKIYSIILAISIWYLLSYSIGPKSSWKILVPRQIKSNVDGLFHLDEYARSVGVVLRDTLENFVAASTIYITSIAFASMAKALAMREGLALANHLGYNNMLMVRFN
jgi:hypothetical protein